MKEIETRFKSWGFMSGWAIGRPYDDEDREVRISIQRPDLEVAPIMFVDSNMVFAIYKELPHDQDECGEIRVVTRCYRIKKIFSDQFETRWAAEQETMFYPQDKLDLQKIAPALIQAVKAVLK